MEHRLHSAESFKAGSCLPLRRRGNHLIIGFLDAQLALLVSPMPSFQQIQARIRSSSRATTAVVRKKRFPAQALEGGGTTTRLSSPKSEDAGDAEEKAGNALNFFYAAPTCRINRFAP